MQGKERSHGEQYNKQQRESEVQEATRADDQRREESRETTGIKVWGSQAGGAVGGGGGGACACI